MASKGTHGHETTLAGGTVGDVGNIISISGPDMSRDAIDISTMDSTNKAREFIAGLYDAGELTAEINYDGSSGGTANNLHTAFLLGTPEVWTVTFPDTSTWVTNGFITNLSHAIPVDDKITQSVTIKFTSGPVYTDVA